MESQGNHEEYFLELDNAHSEMMDEQAAIRRLEARLTKLMSEAVFHEFPQLKNMSPEQFRKFGEALNRSASDFALQSSNFAFRAES